jgi:hypothetical protein
MPLNGPARPHCQVKLFNELHVRISSRLRQHSHELAPNAFYDDALNDRMVRFEQFIYFYRDENPADEAFPFVISVDLRPKKTRAE